MNPTVIGVVLLLLVLSSRSSSSSPPASDAAPGPAATRIAEGHVNGQAVMLKLVEIDDLGHELQVDAATAFMAMRAAAAAVGVALQVNSAFRTYAEQLALFRLYQSGMGNLAASPGWSNHEGGTAIDIESGDGTNAAFLWLTAFAANYRFKRTVPSEPWHWEYV